MARCGRMRFGKPHMQGNDSGFGAETDQCQDKEQAGLRMNLRPGGRECVEIQRAGLRSHQNKEEEQDHRPEMRGHQISPTGALNRFPLVFHCDQKKRSERHDFPRNQKQNGIARHHDHDHARRKYIEEGPVAAAAGIILWVAEIACSVDRRQSGQQKDRQQKERRQGIHFNIEAAVGNGPGKANGIRRRSGDQGRHRSRKTQYRPKHRASLSENGGRIRANGESAELPLRRPASPAIDVRIRVILRYSRAAIPAASLRNEASTRWASSRMVSREACWTTAA